jgi:ribonuclease
VISTLTRIANGDLLGQYRNDGTVFMNREGNLPIEAAGYYTEYVVPTPGAKGAGAQRLVIGENGEVYYTDNHYATFTPVPAADIPAPLPSELPRNNFINNWINMPHPPGPPPPSAWTDTNGIGSRMY